jgi:cbb3-type cytochrome oxidase maturation protein
VETIFVLLPLALLIAAIAVGFFVWAARTGQFDDLETPAVRILFDDDEPRRPSPAIASRGTESSPGEAPKTFRRPKTTADSTRRVSE